MKIQFKIKPELCEKIESIAKYTSMPIEDYIIEKLTTIVDEELALKKLDDFLEPRIQSAKQGNFVNKTVREIMDEALQNRLSERGDNFTNNF